MTSLTLHLFPHLTLAQQSHSTLHMTHSSPQFHTAFRILHYATFHNTPYSTSHWFCRISIASCLVTFHISRTTFHIHHNSNRSTTSLHNIPHHAHIPPRITSCTSHSNINCTSHHPTAHFIQCHKGRKPVYLAVTCHLHFWQNYSDRDLLRATAVTRGWDAGYRNKESAQSHPAGPQWDSNPGLIPGRLSTTSGTPVWPLATDAWNVTFRAETPTWLRSNENLSDYN